MIKKPYFTQKTAKTRRLQFLGKKTPRQNQSFLPSTNGKRTLIIKHAFSFYKRIFTRFSGTPQRKQLCSTFKDPRQHNSGV